MAKSTFELAPGEEMLISDRICWVKGGLKNVFGEAHLTNKRFILVKGPFIVSFLLTRLIGGFIGGGLGGIAAYLGAKVVLDLPLKQINRIEQTSYGLSKNVILVHTLSEGELKISVQRKKPEDWIKKFEEARKK